MIRKLFISFMLAPRKVERMAMAFLSRQQMCGITSKPVTFLTFCAISTESILVLPDGESGNVSTSTPRPLSICAASSSFLSSAPKGGASSTAISFLSLIVPSAFLKKLFFIIGFSHSFLAAVSLDFTSGVKSTVSARSLIYSGVVPQQPPTISAPIKAISLTLEAKYSGLSAYFTRLRTSSG